MDGWTFPAFIPGGSGSLHLPKQNCQKRKKKMALDPINIRLFHPADSEPLLTSMQMCWIGMTEQLLGEKM